MAQAQAKRTEFVFEFPTCQITGSYDPRGVLWALDFIGTRTKKSFRTFHTYEKYGLDVLRRFGVTNPQLTRHLLYCVIWDLTAEHHGILASQGMKIVKIAPEKYKECGIEKVITFTPGRAVVLRSV